MNETAKLRVAVVTPYFLESPRVLGQCVESVAAQSYPCTHFLVADGHPQDMAGRPNIQHFILPRAHRDYGNFARAVGSLSAMSQGFDAVAYLDADNWYCQNHVELMVAGHEATGAAICTTTRTIHRSDGSPMFQDRECDGVNFVDTSCLFVTRAAFSLLPLWATMPPELGAVGDRVLWQFIKNRRFSTAHCSTPTVAYRTLAQYHYGLNQETPPSDAKSPADAVGVALRWWTSLTADERKKLID